LWESSAGVSGYIEYRRDLFDQATIQQMATHFQNRCACIAVAPDQSVARLPLLTAAESKMLIAASNPSWAKSSRGACLHERFEVQVERAPNALAVVSAQGSLSYAELHCSANRLAACLQSLGVGPEVLVALCAERSLETIIGLLAVLKAGGAYVPLDPHYPAERLTDLLQEIQTPVVLTQRALNKTLAGAHPKLLFLEDFLTPDTAAHTPIALKPMLRAAPENLAYVMFTSGTTGQPKGVMIPHRAAVSYLESAEKLYGLNSGDRVLQFASLSLDASVEEIFLCLTTGATLVLRNEAMLASPADFLRACQEWTITVLSLPTAYWHELTGQLAAKPLPLPPTLRLVIVGGEKVLPERLVQWRNFADPRIALLNSYGPTEATVAATCWLMPCEREAEREPREVPIGLPLRHVQALVLEPERLQAPVGVPGELGLGGAGLARGYWQRPELTAEHFIPNPFSSHPGERLYTTGDRVRLLRDGNLEFIRREDRQVKLRGYRVELGEIEAVLRQHRQVADVVVCP
jgi:amino acid adenylation domain-containing protein